MLLRVSQTFGQLHPQYKADGKATLDPARWCHRKQVSDGYLFLESSYSQGFCHSQEGNITSSEPGGYSLPLVLGLWIDTSIRGQA